MIKISDILVNSNDISITIIDIEKECIIHVIGLILEMPYVQNEKEKKIVVWLSLDSSFLNHIEIYLSAIMKQEKVP